MKKILLSLTLTATLLGDAFAVGFESRRFTPYFDMRMAQGAFLPDKGAFFTGAQMGLRVGLLSKINESNSLFALYNMGFAGQGFRFPDTQEFEAKDLSHLFSFEYRWDIGEHWKVRPSFSIGKTYTQTAAAEVWGQGLYDDKTAGWQLAGDYIFNFIGRKAAVTAAVSRTSLKFPNYSDILREFRGESSNTELAGGLKDQILTEYSLGLSRAPWRARLRVNDVGFKREQVVQADATYGGTKQKDSNVILSAGMDGKLWIFETSPEVSYQVHKSNQNFLLFQSATDPAPVYAGDYYSFKEMGLSVPVFMNFTQKWALSGGLDWRHRNYDTRSPRNDQNMFVSGKQANNMVTLSAGLRRRLNEVSSMILSYAVTNASSNNKFERYLPYNYTGQSFSLGYQLTY